MTPLHISEPGQPITERFTIGIDLGTTHSLVATVKHQMVEVIADAHGHTLLPSIVHYTADSVHVGIAAQMKQALDPKNTIVSVKRLMGRSLNDIIHAEHLPYDFIDTSGMVQLRTVAGIKNPVQISADILATLRRQAEAVCGKDIIGAVITVPAYFNDAQRQATKDAANLAGLTVFRLLNEPTAAAIAYGLDNAAQGIYVVYDLGGGTFDISILKLKQGIFEVLATGGDTALGGDDFDHQLVCWMREQAQLPPLSDSDTRLLIMKARQAKESLSTLDEFEIDTCLSSGDLVHLQLARYTFEDITKHLVAKTLLATQKTLRDAQINLDQVDGIILVGGATRMPMIHKAISDFFHRSPLTNLDPDKVVVMGAAIQANLLAGNRKTNDADWLLLDVVPLSLGIETMGGLVEKIISRNTTLPCAYAQDFTTFKDGQTAMVIHVLQGERELVSDCRSLAYFELRGIPPMAAGAAKIRVTYQVDADGLLCVSAREMHSQVTAEVTVKPVYGLDEDTMTNMLQDAMISADRDKHQRALKEAVVEAERLILATESTLAQDSDLLSEAEHTTIAVLIAALKTTCNTPNTVSIVAATHALAQGTELFAERRMDRRVHSALSRKRVDQVDLLS